MAEGGIDALIDANRRKPNYKNRVEEAIEAAVSLLPWNNRIFVSPSGVRSVWLRHSLESFKKRLLALGRLIAETDDVLTKAQVQAGGSGMTISPTAKLTLLIPVIGQPRNPFYVGTIKGVGRIYW